MSDVFNRVASLSPEERSSLVMRLRRKAQGAETAAKRAIPRRQKGVDAPLSFAQQRLWFLHQLEPTNAAYQLPLSHWLEGPLNVAALEASINEIIRRHEALRTTFRERDGAAVQIVSPSLRLPVPLFDLSGLPENKRYQEADCLCDAAAAQPFDLEQGPLLRAMLVKVNEEEHLLFLVIHHIVTDGWSMDIFVHEQTALYEAFLAGRPSPLPDLPLQLADFAAWQREQITGAVLAEQLAYWRKQLSGDLPMLEIPTDRPRPLRMTYSGADQYFQLTPNLTERLKELSRHEGATLFMTLLAAFLILLYRYTGQEDVILGTGIAGRNYEEIENVIGFFVNTLALRTNLSGRPTFRELLGRVREVALGAYEHQEMPFEKLVEELQPERDPGRQPFFQVIFNLQTAPAEEAASGGLTVTPDDVGKQTRFDLEFHLWDTPEGIVGPLLYNTDLFDEPTIGRLLQHYQTLLEGIVANPETRLAELPLLSEAERAQLWEWNETKSEYGREQCIQQLVEAQAARRPEALAVVYGAEQLSYGELNRRANQLAHYLRRRGVGAEVRVGVLLERSVELVVALLGILKAGGAYLPLDSSYPVQRLRYMLEDAGVRLVLTERGQAELEAAGEASEVIYLDESWEQLGQQSEANPELVTNSENLAYVIYTSGSTGQPKGVEVTHRAINRLVSNTNYVQLGERERVAQVSNSSFDAATFEIWGALVHGGQLVGLTKETALSAAELARQIAEQQISVMFLTTALFNQIAQSEPGAFAPLRYLLFGGEASEAQAVRRVLAAGKPEHLLHVYGPTENTTFTSWYEVREVAAGARTIPIGRAIANTEVWVLDQQGQVAPLGVVGELYIGGEGLARGYLARPALTAEQFVPHPYSAEPGARLYRTGDLVRLLSDGNIEFLKRMDQQVKVRGFRVELGEIEAALQDHAAVRDSVVVAREDTPGNKRLVAYVVRDPEYQLVTGQAAEFGLVPQLRSWLQERLPDYMMPSNFVILDKLPLNANGKVDRHALPAPEGVSYVTEETFIPPRTPEEEKVAEIWAEVLEIRPISVEANFFDLGGHSLLATRLISRIREAWGTDLPLRVLFDSPTVAALASHLATASQERNEVSRIAEMLERVAHLSEDETKSLLEQAGGSQGI
jgi:amino acid adenylation domain-containing protein